MNKIIILIVVSVFLLSCDNNDDVASSTDGFTYNSVFYETPNIYFEIDEDDDSPADGYPDSYTFFFTNGRMFDNDANVNGTITDYLYSTNTTRLVFLNVEVSDNPSLAQSLPSAGNTYVVSSINDSVIIHNGQINSVNYSQNGFTFGVGDENIGVFHFPGPIAPTITINNFTYDNANPSNSTIDVSYMFQNENGEFINGDYQGTLGIILD